MSKNMRLSKLFSSENADADEKYFRTKIFSYVQNEIKQDFREYMLEIVKQKKSKVKVEVFFQNKSLGELYDMTYLFYRNKELALNEKFYIWSKDVLSQLQKLHTKKSKL